MRILLVTEFFSRLGRPVFSGGVETRTFYTAKYLAGSHEVVVFCRRRTGERIQEKQGNLLVKRLGHPTDNSVATIASLWSRAWFIGQCLIESRVVQADIVEGSNFVALLPAFLIAIGKRKPKVAWYPDVLLGNWQRYFGPILGLIGSTTERCLLALPWDRIITISDPVASKLKKHGPAPAKISVVACGIEPDQFKRRFQKFSRPTICVVSRLLSYKRVEEVIAALDSLREEIPDLRLEIVGEGPQEQKLKDQAESLGLAGRVSFKKKVSQKELIRLIGCSHLLINPSLIEGFGIVLVEAAAAGTPYIASRIPALKALDGQLQAGVLVLPKSPQKLAQAIKRLLTDKKLYRRKQSQGKQAAKAFSWDKLTYKTAAVYSQVKLKERVAVLIDAWFPFQGGGQVHVRGITRILKERYGYQVKVFGGFAPALWARLLWDFLVIPQVIWDHVKHPFTLIHAHAYSAGAPGKLLSWLLGIPVIFTVHGSNTLDIMASEKLRQLVKPNWTAKLKYRLERWFLTGIRYDAMITVARNFLDYPNKTKRLFVIPNGAKIPKIRQPESSSKKQVSLLFVGRLEKIKGVDLLLKALAAVKDELPQFELKIVGNGSQKEHLRQVTKELNLHSVVTFLGEVTGEKLAQEYRQADLFILPSLSEGQPLTVLEAWANQTPVLVTNVGHNPAMVKEGTNGFLVEPGNSKALEKGLIRAFRHRRDWPKMGERGRELVKTRYTWEEATKRVVEVYKQVLAGGNDAAR
jgi:glycosyltransferase involved in cell wall biosynthesis